MTMPTIPTALITDAQSGDNDAMWDVVAAHETLFAGIVRQVAVTASKEEREDLMQDARAVLLERIRAYDTDAPATLGTFVYRAVRRAVAESWARMTTGMSIDASTIIRVRKALADYDGNQEAAYLAIRARQSGHTMDRGTFLAAVEAMNGMERWDTPISSAHGRGDGNDELSLSDVTPDPSGDVTDPVERRELAYWLMAQIDTRQSYALRSYYGVGMEKADDATVSGQLRTTPASVRKIRTRGISAAQAVAIRHDVAA